MARLAPDLSRTARAAVFHAVGVIAGAWSGQQQADARRRGRRGRDGILKDGENENGCGGRDGQHERKPVQPGHDEVLCEKSFGRPQEWPALHGVVADLLAGTHPAGLAGARRHQSDGLHFVDPLFVVVTTSTKLAKVGLPLILGFVFES